MHIARAVRQIYEKWPYPDPDRVARRKRYWVLPPLPWIQAIWQRKHAVSRVLVAGCGIGIEAFEIRQRFPKAEIVAVDFSGRSISAAKSLQRKDRKLQGIRFLVCDLTNTRLAKIVGNNFDLISCHGVLSYIRHAGRVLRNFVHCLAPDGLLYLGLNGEAHPSRRWRRVLPSFGVDVMNFRETPQLRPILRLFDAFSDHGSAGIANRNAGYLAGDLFGPLIHNWSLAQWSRFYGAAGLHLLGNYSIFRSLRASFQDRSYRFLIPRSRAQIADIFETLHPSSFHRLVLSRQPELRPPWNKPRELPDWRPIITQLYHWKWPRKTQRWTTSHTVKLKSPATNTLVELAMPEWQIEFLRRSNGSDSVSEILRSISAQGSRSVVGDQLYLLYQLCAINLLPPIPDPRKAIELRKGAQLQGNPKVSRNGFQNST